MGVLWRSCFGGTGGVITPTRRRPSPSPCRRHLQVNVPHPGLGSSAKETTTRLWDLILLAEIALLAVQRPHAEVASDLTARRGISNTAVSST